MKDTRSKVKVSGCMIANHSGYATALAKLKTLNEAAAEADREVERAKSMANRSEATRRYIARAGVVLALDEESLKPIVVGIIDDGSVSPEILARVRRRLPDLGNDCDLSIIHRVMDAEACKDLLKRAISVQRCETLRNKNAAVAEICNGLREERLRIGRALATALLQFSVALRDEISFMEKLQAQDPSIPSGLSLVPFPLGTPPSSSEAADWVARALQMPVLEATALLAAGGESSREVA